MKKYSIVLLLIAQIIPLYPSWYCKQDIKGSFEDVADIQFYNGSKVTMSTATQVSRWNIETGKQIDSFPNNFGEESVVNTYVSDTNKLFVIAQTGERKLINPQTKNVVWQEPATPNIQFAKITFNDDKSRILIQSPSTAIVVDAQDGKIKTTLWDGETVSHSSPFDYRTYAQFVPQSRDVVVIHSGWLNNTHNDGVEYKNVIPQGAKCALFSSANNKLVYCGPGGSGTIVVDDLLAHWSNQENNILQQTNNDFHADSLENSPIKYESFYSYIVDMVSGKKCAIKGRDYTLLMRMSLHDDGKKLLCCGYSPVEQGDYKDYYCYVDLFNLEETSEKPELTIPCDSEPYCKVVASSKNLLLLGMLKKCQLWDTASKVLLQSFVVAEWPTWMSMNPDCNQIAIVEKDHVAIYEKEKDNVSLLAEKISTVEHYLKKENPRTFLSSLCCVKAISSLYNVFCGNCCSK